MTKSKYINDEEFRLVHNTDDLWINEMGAKAYLGDVEVPVGIRNKRGYKFARHDVVRDGVRTTSAMHRLVCLAWKDVPENYLELDVNHLDNIPGNDWASNLEWTTKQGNIQHAVSQHRMGNEAIYFKKFLKGNIESAATLGQAGDITGVTGKGIGSGLRDSEVYVSKSGYIYSRNLDKLNGKIDYTTLELVSLGEIVLVNKLTNNIDYIQKVGQAFNFFNGYKLTNTRGEYLREDLSTMGSDISSAYKVGFKIGDDIQYLPKPPIDEPYYLYVQKKVNRLRVYNVVTKTEAIYTSIGEVMAATGMSKTAVRNRVINRLLTPCPPYYRILTDEGEFPAKLTLREAILISNISLIGSRGEELHPPSSISVYSRSDIVSKISTLTKVRVNLATHIMDMVELGYMVKFNLGEYDYTSEMYKLLRLPIDSNDNLS